MGEQRHSPQSAWRDRTVLVTGARGFIAGRLCSHLLAQGSVVYGVSSSTLVERGDGIRWIQSEIGEPQEATELLKRSSPDVIFHLAGHVTGSQDLCHVAPTLARNLVNTVHLLTAAVEAGKPRVVLAGSMNEPNEHDPPDAVPCSPYAASKWACTGYARMFRGLYGLPVAIARPFMVYGPGQWDTTKVLPYSILSILRGQTPRLGSGARELDWVYVDDVVDGLLAVADSQHADAEAIDLGTGELTSVRDVVELAADAAGPGATPGFGAIADRPLERPHAARADKTAEMVGWRATTSLTCGLRRTVEWYRDQVNEGLM